MKRNTTLITDKDANLILDRYVQSKLTEKTDVARAFTIYGDGEKNRYEKFVMSQNSNTPGSKKESD